jgi:FAD/FMN-containing dehydrogenase/membrane-bound metal-dependent hydrolase YbcI (DUF457 family)
VDPITHTLCGVALGNALFRRRAGSAAVPILAIASNLPDLDTVVHLTGDPTAVLMRRTIGHSVFLLPVWSAALAWLLGRRYRHLRFPVLFGMVLLGATVHDVFDLINSFGVVLLWPFSRARPELAIVFIIDFVLTGLLVLPLALAAVRRLRPHLVTLSRGALVAVAVYLACCAGNRALASGILDAQARADGPDSPPDFTYVFPEPLGPHRWRGVVRRDGAYRVYLVRSLSGTATLRDEVTTSLDSPVVAAARASPLGRRLEWFFKAPVWSVAGPDLAAVHDLRFRTLVLRRPPVFEFTVPAPVADRPPAPSSGTAAAERTHGRGLPPGYQDDASRLNATQVKEVWPIPADPAQAEEQLRRLLARATKEGLKVSIAGAGHTMGGHTLYPGGIVLDMVPFRALQLDAERNVLRAGAGARWSEILPYLDRQGRSIEIMQSNNDFTVGGTISVNAHGWQPGRPPIASTVESFRLMRADGQVLRCSRQENADLFRLALGGYGLFGVILDVDLRVVPNERYKIDRQVVPAEKYLEAWRREVRGRSDAAMAYGRLCIDPDRLFDEAILTVFHREAPGGKASGGNASGGVEIPPISEPGMATLRRAIFRGSEGTEIGKKVRWELEKKLGESVLKRAYSRNQLLNESADVYADRSSRSTDILHEYFIPQERLATFLASARRIVLDRDADLLNVTVREVLEDKDTFLRYADQDLFALVMLFSQDRTPEGEARMEAVTRDLIDAALAAGGRYYLPYRLHARPDQFGAAYPQAERFFALKREHDPQELFQNRFYIRYGRPAAPR